MSKCRGLILIGSLHLTCKKLKHEKRELILKRMKQMYEENKIEFDEVVRYFFPIKVSSFKMEQGMQTYSDYYYLQSLC